MASKTRSCTAWERASAAAANGNPGRSSPAPLQACRPAPSRWPAPRWLTEFSQQRPTSAPGKQPASRGRPHPTVEEVQAREPDHLLSDLATPPRLQHITEAAAANFTTHPVTTLRLLPSNPTSAPGQIGKAS